LHTGGMVLKNDWNDKSRMTGDCHVRFCERLGLKCPCLLDILSCGSIVNQKNVHKPTRYNRAVAMNTEFYLRRLQKTL